MSAERRDYYYFKAKNESLRSRAAYKLREINRQFDLFRIGDTVLDIGSSPGGWSEIIHAETGSPVLAVDRVDMKPVEGVKFHRIDLGSPDLFTVLSQFLSQSGKKQFDVIVSDAMVKTSGQKTRDHAGSYLICERVMEIAKCFLRKGGAVLVKQFQGDMTQAFVSKWKKNYTHSRITKPSSSRNSSAEIYLLFTGHVRNG